MENSTSKVYFLIIIYIYIRKHIINYVCRCMYVDVCSKYVVYIPYATIFQVNNAGTAVGGNLDMCTVQDVESMFNTHVRSVFMITKRAIPHLKKTKGGTLSSVL